MTPEEVVDFINQSNGKIFAIEFIKRSTGEIRHMTCRTKVWSHLKGGTPAYDFSSNGLICVFDMSKNNYRAIPIEGIIKIKINGKWEEVIQPEVEKYSVGELD